MQEQIIPVYSLTIGVNSQEITFTPTLSVFEGVFADFLSKLNETVGGIPSLMQEKAFNPFTQPILYGKLENYKPVEDQVFFSGTT